MMTTRKRERQRIRLLTRNLVSASANLSSCSGETRRTLITTIWRFRIRYSKTFAMFKLHIAFVADSSIHAPNSAIVLGSYASA